MEERTLTADIIYQFKESISFYHKFTMFIMSNVFCILSSIYIH